MDATCKAAFSEMPKWATSIVTTVALIADQWSKLPYIPGAQGDRVENYVTCRCWGQDESTVINQGFFFSNCTDKLLQLYQIVTLNPNSPLTSAAIAGRHFAGEARGSARALVTSCTCTPMQLMPPNTVWTLDSCEPGRLDNKVGCKCV